MIKVTIIIPIYCVEGYIESCLESIFLQECDEAAIECILVDDCSPDHSMEVAQRKLKNYHGGINFMIMTRESNGGLCAARNTALEVASGDYILFVDSDDQLVPDTIKLFINSMKEKGDVDVIMGNTFLCKKKRNIMSFDTELPFVIDNTDEGALRRLLSRELFHTSWNKMVKRTFFTEKKLYFVEGLISEDLLWSYLLFLNADKILIIPQSTYIYRDDNPLSITNTSFQKVKRVVRSRIITCSCILSNPPKKLCSCYFTYVFFILAKAIDLFEKNRSKMRDFKDELYNIRNIFLKATWKAGYHLLFFFFLTSVKPFYYLTYIWFYRRYFDRIQKKMVSLC